MFKFELNATVAIARSGETGHIQARGEYLDSPNQYWVMYTDVNGKAVDGWFRESELKEVTP